MASKLWTPARRIIVLEPPADIPGLLSYWPLNDASVVDKVGGRTLTANNTPTGAAGPGGFLARATQFAQGTPGKYMSLADFAAFPAASITIGFWHNSGTTGIASGDTLISKFAGAGQRSFSVDSAGASSRLRLIPVYDGSNADTFADDGFGTLVANTWYFTIIGVDVAASLAYIQTNNTTPKTQAYSHAGVGFFDSTAALNIGNRNDGTLGGDVKVCGVSLFPRWLNAQERKRLANPADPFYRKYAA